MNKVQDSSDCCINSKFSSFKNGYFEDNYLSLFTKRLHRRSPIINRGYYIRFQALEKVFQCWSSAINSSSYQKSQIISLGAGYDSSYFRLKNNKKFPPGCHYVEIDFPEVMKRKYELIKDVVSPNKLKEKWPSVVLCTEDYSMLGLDLTAIQTLKESFASINIDYEVPTLFLSECSIIYIDPKDSDTFITWVQDNFIHSAFVSYEQVYPFDAFGLIMCYNECTNRKENAATAVIHMRNHFALVGCPLKSITKYPDEESQYRRYKELGWSECYVINMYDFFMSFYPEEKIRIQQLEMFDEYEMWHEMCLHYVLICAAQGFLSKSFASLQPTYSALDITKNPVAKMPLNWKSTSTIETMQRFGHQVIFFSSDIIMVSGGFGVVGKKHQRLGDIILYHTRLKKYLTMLQDGKSILGKRMFHSMTRLSNDVVVITGGRSSPKEIFRDILILKCCNFKDLANEDDFPDCHNFSSSDINKLSMPVPTWRHSASLINVKATECIFVFGGCSEDYIATNNCFILDTESWKWSTISVQEHTPNPRHSHSAVTYKENCVIISGGLTQDEVILNSFHIFSCASMKWKIIDVTGLFPRYSHTSHIWNDYLLLVGGITSNASYKLGVGVLNLKTLQTFEVGLPGQDPEFPILLSNHSSYTEEDHVFIVGGGGNCFSFGTHFNGRIVNFNIKEFVS